MYKTKKSLIKIERFWNKYSKYYNKEKENKLKQIAAKRRFLKSVCLWQSLYRGHRVRNMGNPLYVWYLRSI